MVKQGYKQTNIGVIPEEWECVEINDEIKEISMGPFGSDIPVSCFVSSGIPVLNGNSVSKVVLIDDFKNYVSISKSKSLKKAVAHRGDIIVTHRGTIGQVSYIPKNSKYAEYVISQSQFRVRLNPIKANPHYVVSYLLSPQGQGDLLEMRGHTGVPALAQPTTNFRKLLIPFPPLAEQEQIAEVLSNIDNMIFSIEKLIAKKKAIKQGAMQELLTGKKRLIGFNEKWIKVQLKDIFEIHKGSGLSKEKLSNDGKYNCILYGELFTKYSEVIIDVVSKTNFSEGLESHKYDVLMPGSTTTNGLDLATASVILKDGVLLGGDIVVLRPKCKVDTRIFGYLLPMQAKEILQHTQGITIVHLNTKSLQNMEVQIPKTFEEQTAIASILFDMDNEIEALEQKLAKTRQLKQGMMQQLLTGKIRLIDNKNVSAVTVKQNDLTEVKTGHNHQFDDAVMIAAIVNAFYSEKYPLGRKKVQKLLYLLRRKQEVDISEFKKKAAGPYADEVRYKGGEPIAKRNGYIVTSTSSKGTSFSKGKKIDTALSYVQKWGMEADFEWLVSQFRYTSVNDLELYATIDMAVCDLQNEGIQVSVDAVKNLIGSNKEWKAKLKKNYFSDTDIARAIAMSKKLFS